MSTQKNQILRRNSKGHLLRGTLAGLAIVLASYFGLLDGLERWGSNMQFDMRGPIPPATPIVIVSIDEDSFDELDLQWPWPRALHGKFVDIVSQGHPAAIGLDIVFAEPSSRGIGDDLALSEAIGRARNVVLGAAMTEVNTSLYAKEDLNPPLDFIRDQAAAFGFVNLFQEEDAFIRSASLTRSFQGQTLDSFDYHLYHLGKQAGIPAASPPPQGIFLINFRGAPKTFPTIPFYQVVNGEVGPEAFRGKIVLVGATSPILHDVFPTPFAKSGDMPGIEIHANVLETVFQGIPLTQPPTPLKYSLILMAGILAVWLTHRVRPLSAFAGVLAVGACYLTLSFFAFIWGRLLFEVAAVPLTLLLGYGSTVVEITIQEQREKRRLSRYFSPAVVTAIVRQKDDVNLGSTRRRITVLFSDIRGFTTMSEKMSPEEVGAFLREYFTVMTAVVFQHGGTVDKYIGDAIMALYNVPFDQPDHAEQAVRTALTIQEQLQPLAARFQAKYGADLRCGVGIHTGDAVVGTFGSEQRLEYTAIGDTVNLGSRLEGITKDFNVSIVISESTFQEVQGKFPMRYLGEVKVKGKDIPVKIHAVAEKDTRTAIRAREEGTVRISDNEVAFQASVNDVNLRGLSVQGLPKELPQGQILELRLDLPMVEEPVHATAQVVWSTGGKAGLQFLDLKPRDQKTLEKFVTRQRQHL